MKKKISLSACLILLVAAAFVSFQITYVTVSNKYEKEIYGLNKWQNLNSKLDGIENAASIKDSGNESWKDLYTSLAETDNYVRNYYIGKINEQDLEDYLLSGYIYGIGDKYASYMNKKEYEAYIMSTKTGSMVGIGVRIIYDNTLGGIYITSVMPDSSAQEAGILPGDVIITVEGDKVSDLGYYNSYNLIKDGKEGESVNVEVATASSDYSEIKKISLQRRVVKKDTVQSHMLSDNVAYVNILEFDETTSDEFVSQMKELQKSGAKKYIFDVRNNPGGNVVGVKGVLDYLLPEGPIIKYYSNDGNIQTLNSDANEIVAPMIVLINGNTASGGELFAAALRDYQKATLVGTKTYGKGTMQTIIPLSNGGGIKLSTQMYDPPYGENYEGKGIEPDIKSELVLPEDGNFYKLTEDQDSQLQEAIRLIKDVEAE